MLQEQHLAQTDPNRAHGTPRATFATAINLEPLPTHRATELSHPMEDEVILGPRRPLPAAQNCLEAQSPSTHPGLIPSSEPLRSWPSSVNQGKPTLSFYSMADTGHCYCTQRRDLVTRPRRAGHSHCECPRCCRGGLGVREEEPEAAQPSFILATLAAT